MFKRKVDLLIISLVITIGLFVYLTIHHFSLKLGLGGSSLCEISSKINCDATATSRFAELFHLPIALWGAVFHLIILSALIFYRLGWTLPTNYLRYFLRFCFLFAAAASLCMGLISSFVIQVFCPFCLASYLFTFINLALGWSLIHPQIDFDFKAYFSEHKTFPILLALVPVLTWILTGMINENYGLAELQKRIPEVIRQWQTADSNDFDLTTGIQYGPPANGAATFVEFADFKCPHCRMASQSIASFLKGKRDIKFIYKTFPLDGNCNPAIEQKGDGSRCELAAWALCADQIAQKGWDAQHWIFQHQEDYLPKTDLSNDRKDFEKEFNLDSMVFEACVQSTATYEKIKKMAAEGDKAKVSGTPTIFFNGKKLQHGQFIDILNAALEEAK